jgi:peptidoglycan/LPS O-acetylase OafA/YrhL
MSQYIKGIDGLRAIAVLSVIVFHLNANWLPGGFSGVDIFFVISGYVVTLSLLSKPKTGLSEFLWEFYKRRFVRIYPALIFMLVTVSIAVTFFLPKFFVSKDIDLTATYAFFGLSNFYLSFNGSDYFSPSTDFNPFVHTWSLGVEEQFYLVFPLLFFYYLIKPNKLLISSLLVVSFLYSIYVSSENSALSYYILPSRFWELSAGCLLSLLHFERGDRETRRGVTNNFAVGLVIISLGVVFSDKTHFPFPWAILSVVGTLILINAIVTTKKSLGHEIFTNPFLIHIGKLSYSLYLWHWAVFVFYRWTVGLDSIANIVSALFITYILSYFSYNYVEKKFSKTKFIQRVRARGVVLTSCIVISVTAFVTYKGLSAQPKLSISETANKAIWSPYTRQLPPSTKTESKPTIYVIGDSHAGAYGKMLRSFSDETHFNVVVKSEGGCGITNMKTPVLSSGDTCASKAKLWISELEEKIQPNDIVFLATLKSYRLVNQNTLVPAKLESVIKNQYVEENIELRKQAYEESIAVIEKLSALTKNIVLDSPKPVFNYVAFRCADWYTRENPICQYGPEISREFFEKYRKSTMDSLLQLQSAFPHVVIWDPIDELCREETCNIYRDGKPLFFDADHLSGVGNEVILASFSDMIFRNFHQDEV